MLVCFPRIIYPSLTYEVAGPSPMFDTVRFGSSVSASTLYVKASWFTTVPCESIWDLENVRRLMVCHSAFFFYLESSS